jgi:hypothetical protein
MRNFMCGEEEEEEERYRQKKGWMKGIPKST